MTLLYDADCGFCTRAALFGARILPRVQVRPMQDVDLPSAGVDPVRAQAEIPYVGRDGAVTYGSDAIAHALIDGGRRTALAGRVLLAPLLRLLARRVYHLVGRNRHRLPGGSSDCALPR